MTKDDPMLRLRYYRETGQDAEAKQYEAYLRDTGQYRDADPNAALHASYASGRLAKNNADKNAAEQTGWWRTNIGGMVDAVLEAPETVAAGFPGASLLMSKGHSLLYGKPMSDVQRDINERTSDIPYASAIGRGAGAYAAMSGGPAALASGGAKIGGAIGGAMASAAKSLTSPAIGGAALMGSEQFLNNDQNQSLLSRAGRGVAGGLFGLGAGKLGEVLTTTARSVAAPSLGKAAEAIRSATRSADDALYGAAEQEGLLTPTTPQIQSALRDPAVAPFANIVRNSKKFAGANDATVLRETYKLMSEQSVKRGGAMATATDFKAGTSLEKDELDLAKRELLDAADSAMPTFRKAVETHARNARINRAFATGANAGRREMSNTSIAGERLPKLSPVATRKTLDAMSQDEAEAFTKGVLGRTFERMTPGANPINLFGIPRAVQAVYRAGPLLRAADRATGYAPAIFTERGLLALLDANAR